MEANRKWKPTAKMNTSVERKIANICLFKLLSFEVWIAAGMLAFVPQTVFGSNFASVSSFGSVSSSVSGYASASMVSSAQTLVSEQSQPATLRFSDLAEKIRARNQNLDAARLMTRARAERKGFLKRSFLPEFDLVAGQESLSLAQGPTEAHGYWKIESRLNIYNGGRDQLEDMVRTTEYRSAQIDAAFTFQRELLAARKVFWQIVAIQRRIEVRRDALSKNEAQIKDARQRKSAGVAGNADTVQFELFQASLMQQLRRLQMDEAGFKEELAVLLGFDSGDHFAVARELPDPEAEIFDGGSAGPTEQSADQSVDQSVDRSVEQSVEQNQLSTQKLELVNLGLAESRLNLRVNQRARWWRPSIQLYSSLGLPSLSDEFERARAGQTEVVVGLRLHLGLANGLEAHSEAQAQAFSAQAEVVRAKYRVREFIGRERRLRSELAALRALIRDARADEKKAEQLLLFTSLEYRRGIKNGPDLLAALEKTFQMRELRIDLVRAFLETQAEQSALSALAE